MKKILVTADPDDAVVLTKGIQKTEKELVHLPLENYSSFLSPGEVTSLLNKLDSIAFVIYGGLRNTRFFLQWLESSDRMSDFQEKIHLVMNREEADLLEEAGIPAIMPREGGRPIDLMEFLLRLSTSGTVLYPCPEGSSEEMPGLLQELDMPVLEFPVCRPVPMDTAEVERCRSQLKEQAPDSVLFHSRGSVVRTLAAFPDMALREKRVIAASPGVAEKLKQEGVFPADTAEGSWSSVLDRIVRS